MLSEMNQSLKDESTSLTGSKLLLFSAKQNYILLKLPTYFTEVIVVQKQRIIPILCAALLQPLTYVCGGAKVSLSDHPSLLLRRAHQTGYHPGISYHTALLQPAPTAHLAAASASNLFFSSISSLWVASSAGRRERRRGQVSIYVCTTCAHIRTYTLTSATKSQMYVHLLLHTHSPALLPQPCLMVANLDSPWAILCCISSRADCRPLSCSSWSAASSTTRLLTRSFTLTSNSSSSDLS